MEKISSRIHGILDYLTVLFLFISPSLFEMQNKASTFTYALAFIHLALTLFTDFEAGAFKIVSFKIHGMIEIVVSIMLIGIAIWFRFSGDSVSFYYYLIFSAVLFIVWVASDYRQVLRKMVD